MGLIGVKSRYLLLGLHSFLGAVGESLFLCLSQLLEAVRTLCLTASFFHLQSQQWQVESFSRYSDLAYVIISPSLTLILLPPSSAFKDP